MISNMSCLSLSSVRKWSFLLCAILVVGVALLLRYLGRDFVSEDMQEFIIPWCQEIRECGGIKSLSHQVGNYGLLFQTVISLLTYLNLGEMETSKMLSVSFDLVLAMACVALYWQEKRETCLSTSPVRMSLGMLSVLVSIMLLPTIVLNSAWWGQYDSIYTSFCLLSLFFLRGNRFLLSSIFLGIALAWKLQTVLFIPFFLFYYYGERKRLPIAEACIMVAMLWMSGIAAFLQGRELTAPFTIYLEQTDEFRMMFLNFPSFWCLIADNYNLMKIPSIIIALASCGVGLAFWLYRRGSASHQPPFLATVAWSLWTLLLLLPAMHERYAYPLDALLVILAIANRRYTCYAIVAVTVSLIGYCRSLWDVDFPHSIVIKALLYLVAYLFFTFELTFCKQDR